MAVALCSGPAGRNAHSTRLEELKRSVAAKGHKKTMRARDQHSPLILTLLTALVVAQHGDLNHLATPATGLAMAMVV